MKDFYLPDRALEAYLEKDWYDFILRANPRPKFKFAPFPPELLYSNYHERAIEFLKGELSKIKAQPVRLLEVGSSLGRSYYEVALKIQSVKQATLIEPSKNLSSLFNSIFYGPSKQISFDVVPVRQTVASVETTVLTKPFAEAGDLGLFDLVICSNVIDQCIDPLKLVQFLQNSCAPGGTVLLSCTYQWQQKYIGNATKLIENINDLFGSDWKHLGETNIPFNVGVFERHWLNFLSHVSVFARR